MTDAQENRHEGARRALYLGFLKIRATGSLRTANVIADVLHNVPGMMGMGRTDTEIFEEIERRADLHGPRAKAFIRGVLQLPPSERPA